jgi:hypothetical protein
LIRVFRFGIIVLSTIILGLLTPVGAWFVSKTETLAPEKWTARFMAIIVAISGVTGGAIGAYDYMAFDPTPSSVTIYAVGVVLTGNVSFGVYWDPTALNPVTHIDWGELEPGQLANKTIYIKNEGDVTIYATTFWDEESWTPTGGCQYFDLSWDFGNKTVRPNFARRVILQLHVHDDIMGITDFSFDIVIDADDTPYSG